MAANTIAPSGFQPCRRFDGTNATYVLREEIIAYNYGTRINFGDAVYRDSTGTIKLYANGGTTVHGIFRGCRYVDPNTNKTEFYPAWKTPTLSSSTVVTALVLVDPMMTFQIQYIGSALTQAAIGSNVDLSSTVGYTGGTTTSLFGISTAGLGGSVANTNTLPFRIVGIVGFNGGGGLITPSINASYSALNDNQWLEVTMNTFDMSTRTGQA